MSKDKYKTMLNRASLVTWNAPYKKLTHAEKHYTQRGLDRMLNNDTSSGGYGGRFKEFILKGGRKPKPIK